MKNITFLKIIAFFVIFTNIYSQQNSQNYKPRSAEFEFYQNIGDTIIVNLRQPQINPQQNYTFQSKLPYPIIFIHGLNSSSETWNTSLDYYDSQYNWLFGGRFDFCLNADGNNATTNTNFFPVTGADIAAFETTMQNADYYTVNFNVNTDGSIGTNALSNQSAIYKQGAALKKAIERVLQLTEKNKVILVGHSMGGLASRQYIQNAENWQPDNAHHVAKLLTLGTPHGGSNASDSNLGWFAGIDTRSEAIRDLKITYYYSGDAGRFLFGGLEVNNANNMNEHTSDPDFYNFDVNCNGTLGDNVIGLNAKPIDHYIDFSSVIGRITNWLGQNINTDGVVDEPQSKMDEYLTGLTFPTKLFYFNSGYDLVENHTELPGYYYQMMQGLDEPNVKELAYEIETNTQYTGFTTVQNPTASDNDFYKFSISEDYDTTVSISNIVTSAMNASILDSNGNIIGSTQNNSGNTLQFNQILGAGNYYLKIVSSNPSNTDYETPYQFIITTTLSNENYFSKELVYYPNPVKDILHINNVLLSKIKLINYLGQTIIENNLDNTTLNHSINVSNLQKGVYIVSLENNNEVKTIKIIKE